MKDTARLAKTDGMAARIWFARSALRTGVSVGSKCDNSVKPGQIYAFLVEMLNLPEVAQIAQPIPGWRQATEGE